MLIDESGRGLFIINHHCLHFIHGELEGPRDMKLGMLSINDVHMLLQKLDPDPSDGGAMTYGVNLKGSPRQAISATDLKFFIHVLLIVLYKKASATRKPLLQIFC